MAMAHYHQDFDSDDEDDPHTFDTMEDLTDDELQQLGLFRLLGYRLLSNLTGIHVLGLREVLSASILSPEKEIYNDIETFFNNGLVHSHLKLRLTRIFRVRRFADQIAEAEAGNINFNTATGTHSPSRKLLLWHGTSAANVTSILNTGFTIPAHAGQMFGPGIYFADRVSKSAQYCNKGSLTARFRPGIGVGSGRNPGLSGVLLLCSVDLGRSYEAFSSFQQGLPSGYDSITGLGQNIPDPSVKKMYHDAGILCGPTISATSTTSRLGASSSISHSFGRMSLGRPALLFNEYVVYDPRRIMVRFVVEFELKQ